MTATASKPAPSKASDPRYGHAPKRVRSDPADVTVELAIPPLIADLPEIDFASGDLDDRHRELWEQADQFRVAVKKFQGRAERLMRADNPFVESIELMNDRNHLLADEAILRLTVGDLATDVLEAITRSIGELIGLDMEDERTARKAAEAAGIKLDPRASLDRHETPERARRSDRISALRSLHRQWTDAAANSAREAAACQRIAESHIRKWAKLLGLD